ncbi:hypothetical protein OSB04_028545 [Centaurea solstitialis]|uniref:Uncharacterized protein n=1 Tax=Centaurea solstitialis TaxID=347529 RepID=A0AA38SFS5_9ASTR|nr:hypothetical protein OSB04_028545 [Centaurea solstitialis]
MEIPQGAGMYLGGEIGNEREVPTPRNLEPFHHQGRKTVTEVGFDAQYVRRGPRRDSENCSGLVRGREKGKDKHSLFCPDCVANERMKMYRYTEILKLEIREFVVMAQCKDFHHMHGVARIWELEHERQSKRKKVETAQMHAEPVKKFKLMGLKS